MFPFRLKTGRNAALGNEGGISIDVKNLGRTLRSITSVADPSEVDGDNDGFVTGPDGRDNVPFAGVAKAAKDLWSDKRQKALEADEKRVIGVAKKLKGRQPKHDVQRMNELLLGARNREDAIAARKIARDWAKSIFEMDGIGENGEYKVRLYKGTTGVNIMGRKNSLLAANDEDPYPHIRIGGEILDKDGNRVGFFERHIYINDDNPKGKPHVYHEVLRINDAHKGKGIGSDFTLASELMYTKLGIDEIHLNAGLSDGGYTWLRAGYGFKSDKERVKLAKQIEQRYQEMLRDAGSKENIVKGGFMTAVGRHFSDDDDPGTKVKMPEPFLPSVEDLDNFLKVLGQIKTHAVGSDKEMPPSTLALFGDFSRRILRGTNFDVKKPVRSFPEGQKTLVITGLDIITTKVYD